MAKDLIPFFTAEWFHSSLFTVERFQPFSCVKRSLFSEGMHMIDATNAELQKRLFDRYDSPLLAGLLDQSSTYRMFPFCRDPVLAPSWELCVESRSPSSLNALYRIC